ncbi:MAG: hypothetical protein GY869_20720, partial [Planctomycetes bacterium]|nr:hypothetical protein [Planctomycetota bacterium]
FDVNLNQTSHEYTATGQYTVTLSVNDGDVVTEQTVIVDIDLGDVTPPEVSSFFVNDTDVQRSSIESLAFVFSESVSVAKDDLLIYNDTLQTDLSTADYAAIAFAYNNVTYTATWDLSAIWIDDGFYSANLLTDQVADGAGNKLVSNGLINLGDVHREAFHKIDGDSNGDSCIDGSDLIIWQQNYDPLRNNINTPAMGDWNRDGYVDGGDLGLWQINYDPIGLIPPSQPYPGEPITFGPATLSAASFSPQPLEPDKPTLDGKEIEDSYNIEYVEENMDVIDVVAEESLELELVSETFTKFDQSIEEDTMDEPVAEESSNQEPESAPVENMQFRIVKPFVGPRPTIIRKPVFIPADNNFPVPPDEDLPAISPDLMVPVEVNYDSDPLDAALLGNRPRRGRAMTNHADQFSTSIENLFERRERFVGGADQYRSEFIFNNNPRSNLFEFEVGLVEKPVYYTNQDLVTQMLLENRILKDSPASIRKVPE